MTNKFRDVPSNMKHETLEFITHGYREVLLVSTLVGFCGRCSIAHLRRVVPETPYRISTRKQGFNMQSCNIFPRLLSRVVVRNASFRTLYMRSADNSFHQRLRKYFSRWYLKIGKRHNQVYEVYLDAFTP